MTGRPAVEPAPGHAYILVIDERDKVLRRISPQYATRALLRGEIESTDRPGVMRVIPSGWNPQPTPPMRSSRGR